MHVVCARVLVAADGAFSAVRQQCLGDGPPTYDVSASGALCVPSVL